MTYTPGEIRAAEDVSLDSPHPAGDYVMVEKATWQNALSLSEAILRHRADYDAEGMPLPVDEAFVRSFGEPDRDDDQAVSIPLWHGVVVFWVHATHFEKAHAEFAVYSTHLLHQLCNTRPQLRALIEVMG